MSQYLRRYVPGGTYFFTVVTHRRRRILTDRIARDALREALTATQSRYPFDIFAIVLLPDHLHCIWTLPDDDHDFSRRWATIKRLFTQSYLSAGGQEVDVSEQQKSRRQSGIWQPRFWERNVREEEELYALRDYIHLNPVRHGLVDDPLDWPYSSAHQHLERGWLAADWTSWSPISADVVGE